MKNLFPHYIKENRMASRKTDIVSWTNNGAIKPLVWLTWYRSIEHYLLPSNALKLKLQLRCKEWWLKKFAPLLVDILPSILATLILTERANSFRSIWYNSIITFKTFRIMKKEKYTNYIKKLVHTLPQEHQNSLHQSKRTQDD